MRFDVSEAKKPLWGCLCACLQVQKTGKKNYTQIKILLWPVASLLMLTDEVLICLAP